MTQEQGLEQQQGPAGTEAETRAEAEDGGQNRPRSTRTTYRAKLTILGQDKDGRQVQLESDIHYQDKRQLASVALGVREAMMVLSGIEMPNPTGYQTEASPQPKHWRNRPPARAEADGPP